MNKILDRDIETKDKNIEGKGQLAGCLPPPPLKANE